VESSCRAVAFESWIAWERSLRFKCSATSVPIPVRIAWLPHCAKSDALNGPSLLSNGCKAPICASISNELLVHLSPLGWEHINLAGDCVLARESTGCERSIKALAFCYLYGDEEKYFGKVPGKRGFSVRFDPVGSAGSVVTWRSDLIGWFDAPAHALRFGSF
jgi:hypothetical protein